MYGPVLRSAAGSAADGLPVSSPDDPEEREADQIADRIMRSASDSCDCGGTCGHCGDEPAAVAASDTDDVVHPDAVPGTPATGPVPPTPVSPATDVPKPPDQPSQFPPQDQPKTGEERVKDLEDKLSKGATKALGQGLSLAADEFSKSWLGTQVTDGMERDPVVRFFTKTPVGIVSILALGVGGLSAGLLAEWSARDPGAPGAAPKDEKITSLQFTWGLGRPTDFQLKTPWVDTPKVPAAKPAAAAPLGEPPELMKVTVRGRGICTPTSDGEVGGPDDAAFIYLWLTRNRNGLEKPLPQLRTPPMGPGVGGVLFQRKHGSAGAPDPSAIQRGLSSAGAALEPAERTFMESRFGTGLGHVRVHVGSEASAAAASVNANAFTVGDDVVFGGGKYASGSVAGRRLLAHELTHVVQHSPVVSRSPEVAAPRGLDPASEKSWGWYGTEEHRKDPAFLRTVSAARDAAVAEAKALSGRGIPTTDEERVQLDRQIATLIRLTAVTMVAQHRARLDERRSQFEQMLAPTAGNTGAVGGGGQPAFDAAADTAAAVRAAAQVVRGLNAERETLEDLRAAAARAVRLNSGADALEGEYAAVAAAAEPRPNANTTQSLLSWRERVRGQSWGTKKLRLRDVADEVKQLRERQIAGIQQGLADVYDAFPVFAVMPATLPTIGKTHETSLTRRIVAGVGAATLLASPLAPLALWMAKDEYVKSEPPDDITLLAEVRRSFDRLLGNTDEAIVKIGAGGIDPLDLPGAVAAVRERLGAPLHTELDRMKQEHEVAKFTEEMFVTLGIVVLTGISGGTAGLGLAAVAATAGGGAALLGASQLIGQVKDAADRQTIGSAATSPDGSLLGVSAPSTFEWVMVGVNAALTAVDLAAVAKELAALSPSFRQKPRTLAGAPIAGETPPAGAHPPNAGEVAVAGAPATVHPSTQGQADLLATSATIEDGKALSQAQRDAELDIVARSEPRPSSKLNYEDEVDVGNGHTWRRDPDAGTWCRFSDTATNCGTAVPGARPMRGRPRVGTPPPHDYRQVHLDNISQLPRDSLGNFEPLPEGVVYIFPGGHSVWREGDVIRHESVLGQSSSRQGTEKQMFAAGESQRADLAGSQRAHTLGQGTGFESPFGIYHAPEEVNQIVQNNGLEEMFRGLRDSAVPGEHFTVSTLTSAHPNSLRLKEVRYEVSVMRGGRKDFMFEYVIIVGDGANPTVNHFVARTTTSSEVAHYFDLVDVPARLRTRFQRFRR